MSWNLQFPDVPVSLDAVVDIVNDIVDTGPTVCSMLHAEKNL